MSKLWAIFVPGADEYHAAPSEAAAKHMAERHTAAMLAYVAKNKLDGTDMTAAEARWRAERTQQLLAQGLDRFEALAQVRQEAKAQPWAAI